MSVASVIRHGLGTSVPSVIWFGYSPGAAVAPTITTLTVPAGQVGVAYSQTLAATGTEPFTWAVTVGVLPAGLTLSSAGVLSGTPTVDGSYDFTVEATGPGGTDTQDYTLDIIAAAVATGPTPGGSGYPVYWQGKRRKKRLEEQPNLHLKKVLDDVVNELYGELTEDDVPPAVQAKAAKLVKPFVAQKDKKLAIPPPAAVDWAALERDATRVRQLIALWRKQEEDVEIEAEDEYLLMMS